MSTSRIIVKNLPPKVNEKRVSELFESCGEITDAKIIRTRAGISRKLCWIHVRRASPERGAEVTARSSVRLVYLWNQQSRTVTSRSSDLGASTQEVAPPSSRKKKQGRREKQRGKRVEGRGSEKLEESEEAAAESRTPQVEVCINARSTRVLTLQRKEYQTRE